MEMMDILVSIMHNVTPCQGSVSVNDLQFKSDGNKVLLSFSSSLASSEPMLTYCQLYPSPVVLKLYFEENALKNIVCKMAAILFTLIVLMMVCNNINYDQNFHICL